MIGQGAGKTGIEMKPLRRYQPGSGFLYVQRQRHSGSSKIEGYETTQVKRQLGNGRQKLVTYGGIIGTMLEKHIHVDTSDK